MLVFKRGIVDPTLKEPEQTSLPMEKMVGSSHADLIKIFEDLNAEDTADPKNKWTKRLEMPEKDGLGCLILQRPIPGRNVNMCKNDSVFRGVSIEAWREYSLNFLKYMEDDPEFKKNNSGGKPPQIIE